MKITVGMNDDVEVPEPTHEEQIIYRDQSKIDAIKTYKIRTGVDLLTAKLAIEAVGPAQYSDVDGQIEQFKAVLKAAKTIAKLVNDLPLCDKSTTELRGASNLANNAAQLVFSETARMIRHCQNDAAAEHVLRGILSR